MTEEILLKAEGLWKKFSRSAKRSMRRGVVDALRVGVGLPRRSELMADEFWALSDINLEVKRGEALGLCGHNGSGKTTLLKTISGLLQPDRGSVTMRGRIGWLVDIGAGLNPNLTGRENVLLRADMLGHGHSKKSIVEELEEFAQLGPFLDTPVAVYSSGMKAKLGFGIATMVTPDILIIDETLAVGDLAFRMRCYERVGKITPDAAVVFVSHGMNHVARVCTHGAFIEGGRVLQYGDVSAAIERYTDAMTANALLDSGLRPHRASLALKGEPQIRHGAVLDVRIRFSDVPNGAHGRLIARNLSGGAVLDSSSADAGFTLPEGDVELEASLDQLELAPGPYDLAAQLDRADGGVLARSPAVRIRIEGKSHRVTAYQPTLKWRSAGSSG